MSVDALISDLGVTLTIKRITWTRSVNGGPTISSTAATTATGFMQVGGASTTRRYGSERARFDATVYFGRDVDVKSTDLVTYADGVGTRTYRVESVRIPDERSSGASMAYQIALLQEDRPRT